MTEKPADERRFRLALAAVTLGGLALRVADVLVLRPTRASGGGYVIAGDSLYYHFQANALADGLGYIVPLGTDLRPVVAGSELITPSAAHPPLYSTYLALWSWLGVDSITGHRLASCLVGAATVALVGLLARRLAPSDHADRVGLGAAAVAALYPGLWINDGVLLSETVAVFTVTLAVAAAYAFWRRPDPLRAGLLGAAIGLAALSRSEAIALVVLVAVPLALLARDRSWGRRLGVAAVSCGTAMLVLSPWLVHNLARFEEPVLLTSSTGVVLSGASCDGAWYGDRIGSYADCFDPRLLSDATQAELCGRIGRPDDCLATQSGVDAVVVSLRDPRLYDESESDQPYAEQARSYIGDHLGRLPVVVAARVGRVWGLYAPVQNTRLDIEIENRGRAPSWAGLLAYWALLPLAVAGLWSMRRRGLPILPFLAVALTVTLAAGATFGVTRYRATAEGLLVVAAALGADATLRRLRLRRASSPGADEPSPPSSAG
ncbi:MAG: glycosyltransferase family 39 protein [Acidimicrobiales bacterium]|nr:glycosyltransferase family 39 protein [Acidimicrobiales bacterium]MCB9371447.1 glycosyltransferase family 39 protein [Microthrixaceae bacterium]